MSVRATAIAVKASVLGAGPAGQRDLSAQRPPGSVELDAGIVGGHPDLLGNLRDALAADVDALEKISVVTLEHRKQTGHTPTNGALGIGIGLMGLRERCGHTLQGAVFGVAMAVEVDDGVSENPVEPGNHALLIPDRLHCLDPLDESALEDLLGVVGVGYSLCEERQEAPAVFEQRRHCSAVAVAVGAHDDLCLLMHKGVRREATLRAVRNPGTVTFGLNLKSPEA